MGSAATVRKQTANTEMNGALGRQAPVAGLPVAPGTNSGRSVGHGQQGNSGEPIEQPRRPSRSPRPVGGLQVDPHTVGAAIKAAHFEVETVLKEQCKVCRQLWETVDEALALELALWESSQPGEDSAHARMLLMEAGAAKDTAQVTQALRHAESCGLPVSRGDLRKMLVNLQQEEELEVLWRCLASALAAVDRIDIEFWSAEADSQGLLVPRHVATALKFVREEECARLQELENRVAFFQDRVRQASARGDATLLEALITEGKQLGVDTSEACKALEELRGKGFVGNASTTAAAQPPSNPFATDGFNDTEQVTDAGRIPYFPPSAEPGPPRTSGAEQQRTYRAAQPFPTRTAGMPTPSSGSHHVGSASTGETPTNAPRFNASRLPETPPGTPPGTRAPPHQASSDTHGPRASRTGSSGERGQRSATRAAPVVMTRQHALVCLGLVGHREQINPDELRSAYKRSAMRWHPDRRQNHSNPDEATARFQEVRAAFELLQRTG